MIGSLPDGRSALVLICQSTERNAKSELDIYSGIRRRRYANEILNIPYTPVMKQKKIYRSFKRRQAVRNSVASRSTEHK